MRVTVAFQSERGQKSLGHRPLRDAARRNIYLDDAAAHGVYIVAHLQ
jgi:hypothetical protein